MKNVSYLNFATILHTEFLVNGTEGNLNNLSVLTIQNTKKIIPDYIPSFTQDVSITLGLFPSAIPSHRNCFFVLALNVRIQSM